MLTSLQENFTAKKYIYVIVHVETHLIIFLAYCDIGYQACRVHELYLITIRFSQSDQIAMYFCSINTKLLVKLAHFLQRTSFDFEFKNQVIKISQTKQIGLKSWKYLP